jgi:hypothetical protein
VKTPRKVAGGELLLFILFQAKYSKDINMDPYISLSYTLHNDIRLFEMQECLQILTFKPFLPFLSHFYRVFLKSQQND